MKIKKTEEETHHVKNRKKQKRNDFHFEQYAQEGNHFLHRIMLDLGISDSHKAMRMLRIILHALRDRLVPDVAIEFAQMLPIALKGIYFDQYKISRTPLKIRTASDFINYIIELDGFAGQRDFPHPEKDIPLVFSIVWHALKVYTGHRQLNKIKKLFPAEVRGLINTPYYDNVIVY